MSCLVGPFHEETGLGRDFSQPVFIMSMEEIQWMSDVGLAVCGGGVERRGCGGGERGR